MLVRMALEEKPIEDSQDPAKVMHHNLKNIIVPANNEQGK